MTVPRQAIVFCGGRGERLMPLTADTPKPMVPVHGRPFLEYLIEQLREGGVERILLLAGYKGEQVASHFAATDGVRVAITPSQWETGRRLKDAAPLLDPQFLLLYGDNFAPVSLPWLAERHETAGRLLAEHRAGTGCALTLTRCQKPSGEWREIGYMLAERDAVLPCLTDGSFDETVNALSHVSRLATFKPGCFYHSISDPERLKLTAEMLRPKKVILLDRDGVLNEKASKEEYVTRREDFRWIKKNITALQRLAWLDFSFVVLTNQAGIGRGIVSRQVVDELHSWMVDELMLVGVPVLDVLVCPHHWDDNCRCRKPLPGMFFDAAKRHNIRLDRTIYVGDDERDQTAARRAGCRFLFAEEGWQDAALDTFNGWGIE